MLQLGDIAAINGIRVPPVDVVTGGSPCQDVSVAGARKGIRHKDLGDEAETRSGLFMEQIRVIRELRDADRKRGRAGEFVRPRFMLWENVPGAFSSNGGRDFKAVLEETIRLAEPDAPDIPCPEKWPLADAYFGDGWSVAYRVLDAQFWGVAQRRRRICLVADFGGRAAPEILFVRKSVQGNPEPCGAAGEGTASGLESGLDSTGRVSGCRVQASTGTEKNRPTVKCLNPWDSQSGRVYDADGVWHSLIANENAGMQRDAVFCQDAIPIHDKATRYRGGGTDRNGDGAGNGLGVGSDGAPCFTLTAADRHAVFAVHQNQCGEVRLGDVANTLSTNGNASGRNAPLCYDARGNGDGKTVCTLTGDHQSRVTDYTAIVAAVDCRCGTESDVNGTLQAKGNGGYSLNTNITVRCGSNIRRITPLEEERLQGFPDGWTDIGEWTDSAGKVRKTSDAARYKALGNSIALPPWKWVLKRISAQYERDATLGSLFDGIGGFPFLWEQINGKGSALWASEIEEFPIAVTRRHFG